MSSFSLSRDDYFPNPPAKKDYGIGVVGCGGIVRLAHLPAYRKYGYRVVACADISADAARDTAQQFDIPQHSDRIEDVLDNPEVEIIDLAVHASVRPEVVARICAHERKPKAILSQKPFALSMSAARDMVQMCEAAGIKLMINQQGRWAPSSRALKHVIDSGVLGHIYSIVHIRRGFQDDPNSWFVKMEDFNIVDHGIHWFDLSRYFSGQTPVRVKATAVMVPNQVAISPMIYTASLEYAPESALMTGLHFNNIVPTNETTARDEWIVDGTAGTAILNGELAVGLKDDPRHTHRFSLEGSWWNDAFGGSMGELMQSLTEGREPQTSGRDNLQSVAVAYAAIESSRSGEAVSVAI